MKKIKKLISVMLTAVMALALSMTAFAAETPTPTGATYNIYQIFTGDYYNGVLSNIKWGKNGTGTEGSAVDDVTLEKLEKVFNDSTYSDTAQLEVITQYADLNKEAVVKNTSATEHRGLTPGYYLVSGTVTYGSDADAQDVESLYVVKVIDGTLKIAPKVGVPTVDKKIVEGNDKVDTNEASIGDEVKYEITGTMPSNIGDYKTYFYKFTDTLSSGLTYEQNSIDVTVNGTSLSSDQYKVTAPADSATGGTIEVTISDLKALGITITAKTEVVLTYTATLNENAVIAGDGNKNKVKLTYSNDPNKSGAGDSNPTGETPEVEVVTYTTELTILKKDEDDKFLPGTQFTLTGNGVNVVLVTEEKFEAAADGTYWKLKNGTYTTTGPEADTEDKYDSTDIKYTKTTGTEAKGTGKTETKVVGTVMEDGTVTFTGLGEGEYTIEETHTLDGYNTIDSITFKLTFNKDTKKFVSNNGKVTVGGDNKLDTSIVNKKGSLLPETGGIGTTIFYVVGAILVIGAGILLVVRKRMSHEQ